MLKPFKVEAALLLVGRESGTNSIFMTLEGELFPKKLK